MAESFTSKQKEIVARKMGYDGPMQMFDEFLAASPSDAQKYSAITSKFAERMAKGGVVQPKKYAVGGTVPTMNTVGTTYEAATTDVTPEMKVAQTTAAPAVAAQPVAAVEATGVTAPAPIAAPTITAASAAPAVTTALEGVKAEQGAVSEQAQVAAATQEPTTTAVSGLEAAQGVATQVQNAPVRQAQAGEMVSGPAVDMAKVEHRQHRVLSQKR